MNDFAVLFSFFVVIFAKLQSSSILIFPLLKVMQKMFFDYVPAHLRLENERKDPKKDFYPSFVEPIWIMSKVGSD